MVVLKCVKMLKSYRCVWEIERAIVYFPSSFYVMYMYKNIKKIMLLYNKGIIKRKMYNIIFFNI